MRIKALELPGLRPLDRW